MELFARGVPGRLPSPERMEAYRRNPLFAYDRGSDVPVDSLLLWALERLSRFLDWGSRFHLWEILLLILCVAAVAYIVLTILGTDFRALLGRRYGSRRFGTGELSPVEDKTPPAESLECALARNDYRQAIRLRFVDCLLLLDQSGILKWRDHATNQDYLREIGRKGMRESFRQLCDLFNRTRYGDWAPDDAEYRYAAQLFDSFVSGLSRVDAGREGGTA